MKKTPRAVAMLDSGLGGLTVLTALWRRLPDVDVIYYADTAHVPYGDRPLAEVAALGQQIVARLSRYEPALIITASGTTCAAFELLTTWTPSDLRMLGVVACGAQAAVPRSARGRIGVVATAGAIASGIFERKIRQVKPDVLVTSVAAPKLVPLVESGAWATDAARVAVEECVQPFQAEGCDAVILGCTHFPHLLPWFERSLGSAVVIIDPAHACADVAVTMLADHQPGDGSLTFEVSGDPDEFARRAFELAGMRARLTRRAELTPSETV